MTKIIRKTNYMKKIGFLALIILTSVGLSVAAFAMDLQSARKLGAVGERLDGYVEILKPSPEATELAKDVNTRRLAEYQRISKENNQSSEIVAMLAAKKIIEHLQSGYFYQTPDGDWVQK